MTCNNAMKRPRLRVNRIKTTLYDRRLMLVANHSRPSYRPSPDVAHAALKRVNEFGTDSQKLEITTDLDVPSSLSKSVQPKLICDLRSVHSIGQILLVCEDKQKGITKLILVKHSLQFLPRFRNTFPVVRVHHEDDTLSILEVYNDSDQSLISQHTLAVQTYNASREDESCLDLRHPIL